MVDYYQILEVSRVASAIEIKASYKRLAMKYHPDHNPNNPFAEDYFKRITEAYRVLGDNSRKYLYDIGGATNSITTQHPYSSYQPVYTNYTPPENYVPFTGDDSFKNLVSKSMKRKIAIFVGLFAIGMVFFGLWSLNYMNDRSARIFLSLAETLHNNKETGDAIVKIRHALSYKPIYVEAYALLAKIHIDRHNYVTAIDDIDFIIQHQTLEQALKQPDIPFKRAWCYFKSYQYEIAQKEFEALLKKDIANPTYKFFKIACLLKNGGNATELCPDIITAHLAGIPEADELVRLYCNSSK